LERENKEKNEIKIEGKPEKGAHKGNDKKEVKAGAANDLKIDLEEIDRIVFEQTSNEKKREKKRQTQTREKSAERMQFGNDPYQDLQETKLNNKQAAMADSSIENSLISVNQSVQHVYQEEDSYINPSNVSKVNQSLANYDNQIHQNISVVPIDISIDQKDHRPDDGKHDMIRVGGA